MCSAIPGRGGSRSWRGPDQTTSRGDGGWDAQGREVRDGRPSRRWPLGPPVSHAGPPCTAPGGSWRRMPRRSPSAPRTGRCPRCRRPRSRRPDPAGAPWPRTPFRPPRPGRDPPRGHTPCRSGERPARRTRGCRESGLTPPRPGHTSCPRTARRSSRPRRCKTTGRLKVFRHQRYKRYAIGCVGSADGVYGSNRKPACRSSLGIIARVKGADESEVFSSARGRNAASLTSSRSGRGSPPTYVMAKMRNVSFAASVTRFRTARIGPARPAMPVSSFTSRSMVWTTDSRGSTYPDGRLLAFAANKGDQWSVYLLDLRTKKDRILLQSEQSVLNPEFSPDGRWIAVQSDFEGDENYNIYLVPVKGAHVQKITNTPFDSAFPRWSPDGTKIAFLSNRDGDRDNVFMVDTTGGDAKQLTNVDDIVGEIAWRPDGRSIAFSAGGGLLDYVGLVDLAGPLEKVVAVPHPANAIGSDGGRPEPWSPNGRELAFVSNVHDHLDIGVLDVKTKRVRFIVQNRWDKTMPLWAPDGKRIAFLENHDGNVQLKVVSRNGKGSRGISPAKGSANRARWAPDAKGLFYHHSTFTQPDRLILRKGERSTPLVDSLREPLPKGELADGKLVRYPSFDGRKIAAWLFVPRTERRRNAAVVDPHGGPESQTLNEWDARFQFLVAEGFTTLAPNYRGVTGRGLAWVHR